ncbi:MAG: hypothetical protein ACI9DJ_001595 [Algoriphagus sp.]|jgi:hypothetical protein
MVISKDISLLIHLDQKPEKATHMDWEWLHKRIPNFDLLLKVYVSVSHQLGIITEDSKKMRSIWKMKSIIFAAEIKPLETKELSEIDTYAASHRIRLFLASFEQKNRPFTTSHLD